MIKEYLHAIASLGLQPKQTNYFKLIENKASPVVMSSYKDVLKDIPELEQLLRRVNLEVKGCYPNSARMVTFFNHRLPSGLRLKYCEGYCTTCGIPINHAFNKLEVCDSHGNIMKEYYFDITLEYVLDRSIFKLQDEEYVSILELTYGEVNENMYNFECFGPWFPEIYQQNHK